jgi:diguanylate cyclase (GGDEF)-like protein
MSSLLSLHSAATRGALADAVAIASEQINGTPYAFVFFERDDGSLAYQAPASETRRRSHRGAIEALGPALFSSGVDARDVAALAEALDSGAIVCAPVREVLTPLADESRGAVVESAIGVTHACAAAITGAGDRWGALLVLGDESMQESHVGLLAAHVGRACANLAVAETADDEPTGDVARSIFDARKVEAELGRELARSQRFGRSVSICVVEATNLRLLRERFGETLTEQLYERLGDVLSRHARDIDIMGAYRESGYTMVLAEASPAGVEAAAQRLAAAAADVRLDGKPVPGLELHLAVGHATAPEDGVTTDALFAAAQRRMYGDAARRVA